MSKIRVRPTSGKPINGLTLYIVERKRFLSYGEWEHIWAASPAEAVEGFLKCRTWVYFD